MVAEEEVTDADVDRVNRIYATGRVAMEAYLVGARKTLRISRSRGVAFAHIMQNLLDMDRDVDQMGAIAAVAVVMLAESTMDSAPGGPT